MPTLTANRVPSYRLHSQSGQAIVTLSGRDILLGRHGSAASKAEYNRRISEWIAAGRQTPEAVADLSVAELIARYKTHVERYYRGPDGKPTGEADNIRHALKPLRKLYGTTPAADFSPLKLKAVREAMIDPKMIDATATGNGWCRRLVNHSTRRIRAMFRWAVENELLQPSVYHGLLAVTGLKHGRTEARESEPVMPVDDTTVEATLPHLINRSISGITSAGAYTLAPDGAGPSVRCAFASSPCANRWPGASTSRCSSRQKGAVHRFAGGLVGAAATHPCISSPQQICIRHKVRAVVSGRSFPPRMDEHTTHRLPCSSEHGPIEAATCRRASGIPAG